MVDNDNDNDNGGENRRKKPIFFFEGRVINTKTRKYK